MEKQWDSQQQYIEKLERMDQTFSLIFEKDSGCQIIGAEERTKLEQFQSKTRKILEKLKGKEFTVAVVGLEKTGKSTLVNALVRQNVLPADIGRCTYSTTEIRAGSEDGVKVSFYSQSEFNNNFKMMMKEIGYPHDVNYSSLNPRDFESYWNSVEESNTQIYQLHNGTTAEDIRAMLEGRSDIEPLLGRDTEEFSSGDDLLRLYITGIGGRSIDGSIVRSAHPYAVKNVCILSTALKDMGNMVLYDVPGFDSPTLMNKQQTEEILKQADAIIFVTNVGDRPNLTGPQLDMLRKAIDDDGVRISDKTFVFGNKLDHASSQEKAEGNIAALQNDIRKYKIADDSRVIVGSAKAFLESNNLLTEVDCGRGLTGANQTIKAWEITDDGVDTLRNKLREYCQRNRFEVLEKRAQSTLKETDTYLNEILNKFDEPGAFRPYLGLDFVVLAKDRLCAFPEQANKIQKASQNEILRERPFSMLIESNMDLLFPMLDIEDRRLEDLENTGISDLEGVYPARRVDVGIREKLKMEFVENVVRATAKATIDRQQQIRNQLVDKFLEVMGMAENSPHKEKLTVSVNAVFDDILIKDGSKCQFNTLIERFATGIIEALVRWPFGDPGRFEKVQKGLPEYVYLSLVAYYFKDSVAVDFDDFYELFGYTNDLTTQMFSKILLHQDQKRMEKLWEEWGHKSSDVDNATDGIPSQYLTLIRKLDVLARQVKIAETKSELVDVLNADIKILRAIMKYSVIPAIGLERVFNSVIAKNINQICKAAIKNNPADSSPFNKWIKDNLQDVLEDDYANIERDNMNMEARKGIVESIRQALDASDEDETQSR